MDTVIDIVVSVVVVLLTAAIAFIATRQLFANLSGERKSIFKAILWGALAAPHAFTAIAVGISWIPDVSIASTLPISLQSVYEPFVRNWGSWAANLADSIWTKINR